jgi:flagellar hook-basal body complex protein FliE
MKYVLFPFLVFSVLMATGCSRPESPQEVSEAFWQAVLEEDAEAAADYSTLVDEAGFDGFEQQWQNVSIEWGRVVIDDNLARVTTTLSGLEGRNEATESLTYLVRKGDDWLVDYYRTGDALKQGPVWGSLVGQLERLGEDLKSRWANQSDEMAVELERLGRELQQQAQSMNEDMSALAEEYGDQLSQHLEELSESLREALKSTPSATPQDRRTLNETVIRLEDQREQLSEANLKTLAESTATAAEAQLQLSELSEEFAAYKAEWRQRVVDMQAEMAEFLENLKTR